MRASLLLLMVLVPIACRKATEPVVSVPRYSLYAYTTSVYTLTPTDSVQCLLSATWESGEPFVVPSSRVVSVRASRVRRGENLSGAPTATGNAVLGIAYGPGDSVRVTLDGVVNATFDGRWPNANSPVSGQWTCGGDTPLGASVAGEARGTWLLAQEYPID